MIISVNEEKYADQRQNKSRKIWCAVCCGSPCSRVSLSIHFGCCFRLELHMQHDANIDSSSGEQKTGRNWKHVKTVVWDMILSDTGWPDITTYGQFMFRLAPNRLYLYWLYHIDRYWISVTASYPLFTICDAKSISVFKLLLCHC